MSIVKCIHCNEFAHSMSVKSICVWYLKLVVAVGTAIVALTGLVMAAGVPEFGVRVALQ